MDLFQDCYELAVLALFRAGLSVDLSSTFVTDADLLAEQIHQTIENFVDAIDADDDAEEKRLDDAERARACNGER